MKYRVYLAWRCEFIFDDLNEAATFAKSAADHMIGDKDDHIKIQIVSEKELEEGGDDN